MKNESYEFVEFNEESPFAVLELERDTSAPSLIDRSILAQ
jgi:hypothetical protein